MKPKNYLEKILAGKRKEVDELVKKTNSDSTHPFHKILNEVRPVSTHFSAALKRDHLAVIAEVKRRSPSRGEIGQIEDPVKLALEYCQGGASAVSILTDAENFGGSLNDLGQVSRKLRECYPRVSLLRKDFILHPMQLAEAVFAGAHAVLLIAHAIGKDLKDLILEAKRLGLETLTEVHDRKGLELALEADAPIIGINHRNLETFQIDMQISEKLRPLIPPAVIAVAESGIFLSEEAKRMRELGFDAILVGEAFVRSQTPAELIKRMRHES